MSRSAGPGSPVSFMCHRARLGSREYRSGHTVTLTGRERRRRGRGALGIRSDVVAREYRCACGHVGWSNHIDLAPDHASRRR